jgi:hypothetical protein
MAAESQPYTSKETKKVNDEFLPLVKELSDPGGRSIVALVPELVAAIRARKNKGEAEALLLFILSSPKATQHVWLTRPLYNPKTGVLPRPSNHTKKQWLDAAGIPPGPERHRLEDAIDVYAFLTGGFPVTKEVSAEIVNKLAAWAPRYKEESATVRKARRQRAKLGNSRPSGHPKATGHK